MPPVKYHEKGDRLFSVSEVINAIKINGGMITSTAEYLGCSVDFIYNLRKESPELKQAIIDARQKNYEDIFEIALNQHKKKLIDENLPGLQSKHLLYTLEKLGKRHQFGEEIKDYIESVLNEKFEKIANQFESFSVRNNADSNISNEQKS